MQYSVLLVDDEDKVRKSIIRNMDWERYGFQVVADAENGEDALEKMAIYDPDLILTDIGMPYMDGLTFIEKVREQYPGKEIVIFSGYNDFEYARKAIRFGVKEYILKPVDSDDLGAILQRIHEELDDRIRQRKDIRALQERSARAEVLLREQFLLSYRKSSKPEDQVETFRKELPLPSDTITGYVGIRMGREGKGDTKEAQLYLENLLKEYMDQRIRWELFSSDKDTFGLLYLTEDGDMKEVLSHLENIRKELARMLPETDTLGVGGQKTRPEEAVLSLKEATEAWDYRRIVGGGQVIYIQDVEPEAGEPLIFGSDDERELIHALKFGTDEQMDQVIETLIDKPSEARSSKRHYQSYLFRLYDALLHISDQYKLDAGRIFGYGNYSSEDFFIEMPDEEVKGYFKLVCSRLREAISSTRETAADSMIQSARQFVEENYADSSLSLEQIADHLCLSQSYFSSFFKKTTGQAFTAYVRQVRMQHAVDLLNQTEDKTYVIAEKVGYEDPFYFSSVFKKEFGMSPNKFRKHG